SIEKRIAKADEDLQAKRAALEDPEIASDAARLHDAYAQMEAAQKVVDGLYARWAELEKKMLEQLEK
ncbi:MAG: ABC transporter C-terminal domain-containing protein, partial [Candidatus Acidiferrales bacterium]